MTTHTVTAMYSTRQEAEKAAAEALLKQLK